VTGRELLESLCRIAPLAVIRVRVQNNVDGSAWMPDGNGIWTIAKRECGFTVWRCVELAQHDEEAPKEVRRRELKRSRP
jgi:hypothetical protein